MKLVVGLGNPGSRYAETYHNVGFAAVDLLASRLRASEFRLDKKSNSQLSEASALGQTVILCKPDTYMNLSGDAVSYLARYYKLAPSDIIVLYDDIDVKKGTVRARPDGSAGTHNGMRSVIAETGLSEFARIRLGIRDANVNIPIINYVLAEIRKEDYDLFSTACRRAAEAALLLAGGEKIDLVMGKYNG